MMLRKSVLLACGALVLSALPTGALAASTPGTPIPAELIASGDEPVARGIIVKTDGTVSSAALERAADRVAPAAIDVTDVAQLSGRVSTVRFDEPVPVSEAREVAADVAARTDVVWAVPDGRVTASAAAPVRPNDALFSRQYQVWDSRNLPGATAGGYSVKAPSLWRATQGKSSVVVAVLDTGVRADHPDLAGQLVAGYDMIAADRDSSGNALPTSTGYRFYTANDGNGRDANPSDPGDWLEAGDRYCYGPDGGPFEASSWHGTHVTGTVAARTNNKIGIAGIAPAVKVQPVRVLGKCGGWDSDVLAGITWASGGTVAGVPANRTPAKVINMSLGSTYTNATDRNLQCVAFASTIAEARSRGSLVVAAAGNELSNADYAVPASCSGVLSVGATSDLGQQAFYSNEGSTVDISAPGGDYVVGTPGVSVMSTLNSGTRKPAASTYGQYMGTSMAAPAVSGAAALLISLGITGPDALETALKAAVSPFRNDPDYSNVVLTGQGQTYNLNLNCTTSVCGSGLLDLSKVPAPIGKPTVSGAPVVGSTLTAGGAWTASTPLARQWMRSGVAIPGATGQTYTVAPQDVGQRLSVRVAPAGGPFAAIAGLSAQTPTVGLVITATGWPSSTTYGRSATVKVSVNDGTGPRNGVVRILRGGTEIGRASTSNGRASIAIAGTKWIGGRNSVRAEFTSGSSLATTAARFVSVRRATPSKVSASIKSTISRKKRAKISVRVLVAGVRHPAGAVRVYDGRKRIATAKLTSTSRGAVSIRLPKLKKGKHRLRVVFAGTSVINAKNSPIRTVRSK